MKHLITLLMLSLTLIMTGCDTADVGENDVSSQTPAKPATHTQETNNTPPKIVAWFVLGETAAETATKNGSRRLSGKVVAALTSQLSFQSSGQIQTMHKSAGQTFTKGEALATLDKTNYRLKLQQIQADYNKAVAARNQARTEVKRYERLVKAKAVSQNQLEQFRLQLKTQQENINTLNAQIQLAKKELADTQLIAPFAGTVVTKRAETGQLATPQIPVYDVQANQIPEVQLSVPENFIQSLSLGTTVSVDFPALATPITVSGRVSQVAVQAVQGAFPVKIQLINPPPQIQSGITAEIRLSDAPNVGIGNVGIDNVGIKATENTQPHVQREFGIPPSALGVGAGENHFVYRIGNQSPPLLEKVSVHYLGLSGNHIQISGNLQRGDKLVRTGLNFLEPRQAVRLMNVGVRQVNP